MVGAKLSMTSLGAESDFVPNYKVLFAMSSTIV